jgi:hypothetical protein
MILTPCIWCQRPPCRPPGGWCRWHQMQGAVWGAFVFGPEARHVVRYDGTELAILGPEHGLVTFDCGGLCLDGRGDLWLGDRDGLLRYDGRTFERIGREQGLSGARLTALVRAADEGLPNNHIQCLYYDDQGHLWIGSESGVTRWDSRHFQTIFSEHLGSTNHILQGSQRRLWFGARQGLVQYSPQAIPPRVRVEQVLADQTYLPTDVVELSNATRQGRGRPLRAQHESKPNSSATRRAPSPAPIGADWVRSNWPRVAPFVSMRSAICPWKRKLSCYTFCRTAPLNDWMAIRCWKPMCGGGLDQPRSGPDGGRGAFPRRAILSAAGL